MEAGWVGLGWLRPAVVQGSVSAGLGLGSFEEAKGGGRRAEGRRWF